MANDKNTAKPLPTQEELHAMLRYDAETGKLYWKARPLSSFASECVGAAWNTRRAGSEAFTARDRHGYKHGAIYGVSFRAHRIIWAMLSGSDPAGQIDHINGVRDDNRPDNLRVVGDGENRKNQKKPKDNTSGHIGVCWNKNAGKWVAEIKASGKRVYLGLFPDLPSAVSARKAAELKYGFHANHGRAVTQGA